MRREAAVDQVVEADHSPASAELDEADVALVACFEPDRLAGGDVEAHAERRGAVELEDTVDLEEVEMRPDLDRPVAGVAHRQPQPSAVRR